ncbi:proline--tRNA ligase [Paenibacillus sp. J31TS4]|uniref:proline--tRNA ligase n=1 Tax=Paenibacillus sp. J31TS4 TaxID=2807195 RepID=UPI001B1BBAC4|nr:proline--tRNA ligase [Paenibacillus sp. J31TS4]GIP38722.1 proline--tRNA ligase [Paenibacillus sp. J31TS4]
MRQQHMLIPTLRDDPAEAEAISHRLLLRAGYIRQLAAGIYTYLPLGLRVMKKIEAIIREEMEAIGAQELLMPAMQPAELWETSGRYGIYGPELIRLKDRHGRAFALGPTHEEVVTTLVAAEIHSHRKLPLTVYQIQTKFRDERRPRFGLMRGREFVMKDAYSFDPDWEGLDRTYRAMEEAYHRIFSRCGLDYRAVEADSGAIGGEGGSHEFMALAESGEDTIVSCAACSYAANLEKAEAASPEAADANGFQQTDAPSHAATPPERLHTPGMRTIAELTEQLGLSPRQLVKTLIYVADGRPVALLVRGDREANEVKLARQLGCESLELADAETTRQVTGAPVGFAGPVGLTIPILADLEAAAMAEAVTGANEADYHLSGVRPGVHFALEAVGDFRNAGESDPCPRCGGRLVFRRGIEMGHVFKLGTKYSRALGALYTDEDGRRREMIMGCYGIGVSRLLAAIAEQHAGESGLRWPAAVAPFRVHLLVVAPRDETQRAAADQLYGRLLALGLDVLLDDREERPGVKFKDADLIGLPVRIVIGRGAADGLVEWRTSGEPEAETIPLPEALERAARL